MLNPKYTSQFTKDIYAAIITEIDRLEEKGKASPALGRDLIRLTPEDHKRLAVVRRWRDHLEGPSEYIDMVIQKFPDGPLRL